MHIHAMNDSSSILDIISSLSDPSRLRVVSVLAEADCCVSELAQRIGLSQSCTTRHLQVLKRAGVLSRTREGKRVLFRIRDDDPGLDHVLELLLVRRPLEVVAPEPASVKAASVLASRPPRRPARLALVPSAGGVRPNEVPLIDSSGEVASDFTLHSDAPAGTGASAVDNDTAPAGAAQQLEDYLL